MLRYIKNIYQKYINLNILQQRSVGGYYIMGQTKSNQELTVATLNFSGIIASPYQFFETNQQSELKRNLRYVLFVNQFYHQQNTLDHVLSSQGIAKPGGIVKPWQYQKKKLQKCVHDYRQNQKSNLAKTQEKDKKYLEQVKHYKSNHKWKIGPLDKQWHENRYCPLYNWKVGIKNNKFMLSKRQFYEQWDHIAHKYIDDILAIIKYNSKKKKHSIVNYINKQLKISADRFSNERKREEEYINKKVQYHQEFLDSKEISKQEAELINIILFQLRVFDYLAYKAILYEIYEDQHEDILAKLEQLQKSEAKKTFKLQAKKYREIRQQAFQKSYLNIKLKIQKIIKAVEKFQIDIFFVQEATKQLVQAVQSKKEDIRIIKPMKVKKQQTFSAIFIRQSKFPKITNLRYENSIFFNNFIKINNRMFKPQKIGEQQIKSFNINKDTVIQAIGNLIIFCCHLTSKTLKQNSDQNPNKTQIQQVKKMALKLQYWFPQAYIIGGGDLNGQFIFRDQQRQQLQKQVRQQLNSLYNIKQVEQTQQQKAKKKLNIFPIIPEQSLRDKQKLSYQTTYKIRSCMQAQTKKAYEEKFQSKDYLISNLEIIQPKILTLNKKNKNSIIGSIKNNLPLLPTNDHPFDHFLVMGQVRLPKPIVHVHDQEYLWNYNSEKLTEDQIKAMYSKQNIQ